MPAWATCPRLPAGRPANTPPHPNPPPTPPLSSFCWCCPPRPLPSPAQPPPPRTPLHTTPRIIMPAGARSLAQRDRDVLFTAVAYTRNQTGALVDLIGGVHGHLRSFITADQVRPMPHAWQAGLRANGEWGWGWAAGSPPGTWTWSYRYPVRDAACDAASTPQNARSTRPGPDGGSRRAAQTPARMPTNEAAARPSTRPRLTPCNHASPLLRRRLGSAAAAPAAAGPRPWRPC